VDTETVETTASDAALARQIATLPLSALRHASEDVRAAARCWNVLAQLGVVVPLVVVADLLVVVGVLRSPQRHPRGPKFDGRGASSGASQRAAEAQEGYQRLLRELAEQPHINLGAQRVLSAELQAVLLARLLQGGATRTEPLSLRGSAQRLPLTSPVYGSDPDELQTRYEANWALEHLVHLVARKELILSRAHQLQASPLHLFTLLQSGDWGQTPSLPVAAFLQLLASPFASQAADFALQMLPSLLETKRARSVQQLRVDGYASIEKRGAFEALVPSEVAHDAEVFEHKYIGDELLYFGRERHFETTRSAHWICVDASASMFGPRAALARGLALALGKKLQLQGDSSELRFFDGKLHRPIPFSKASGQELPALLGYQSPSGRCCEAVVNNLLHAAQHARQHPSRSLTITVLTHAAFRPQLKTLKALAGRCRLIGIFFLPTRAVPAEVLGAFDAHHVFGSDDLQGDELRRHRGAAIVEAVAGA